MNQIQNITPLEQKLRESAYYGLTEELIVTDLNGFINLDKLKPIGAGMNTRVFRLEGTDWVIKEGRWDLDANLFQNFKVKLPASITESVLKNFELQFLPNSEEVIRQYKLYLEMVRFFGYFPEDKSYYHPEIHTIFSEQKDVRKKLKDNLEQLIDQFDLESVQDKIKDLILTDRSDGADLLESNFLPKEYLLYARSISPENAGKNTYFLFQQYIKGDMLHDIDYKVLKERPELNNKLIILGLLILLLSVDKGLVPDLRPRYFITELNEWFFSTDNIILSGEEVKFIDTRWMWNLNDNFVKRGVVIPEMTLESTRLFIINSLSKQLL